MIHFHNLKKGTIYIHTIQGFLIPIPKKSFILSDSIKTFTGKDIYGNEYTIDKDKIDIAFDDEGIYHNFHNEEFFNSLIEQSKGE